MLVPDSIASPDRHQKGGATPFCSGVKVVRSEKLEVRNGGSGASNLEAPHFYFRD